MCTPLRWELFQLISVDILFLFLRRTEAQRKALFWVKRICNRNTAKFDTLGRSIVRRVKPVDCHCSVKWFSQSKSCAGEGFWPWETSNSWLTTTTWQPLQQLTWNKTGHFVILHFFINYWSSSPDKWLEGWILHTVSVCWLWHYCHWVHFNYIVTWLYITSRREAVFPNTLIFVIFNWF